MPCEKPNRAYQKMSGGPLVWTPPNTNKSAATYRALDIPCGTCILCRQDQAKQWAIRISHEAQLHEENAFITLTYNDANLPEHGSLNYEHLQKFWKRLRKKDGEMRYFAVGEYGDESLRPHYHACIFGHGYTHNRTIVRHSPTLLWTCPELEETWGLGNVRIGALEYGTALYTASYVLKKLRTGQQYVRIDETTGELIPLVQPRSFMSRNLGKAWWLQFGGHVEAHDMVVINGTTHKPPKAYDRWLGEVNPTKLENIKKERQKSARKLNPNQNHARARNARARAKNKSKKV